MMHAKTLMIALLVGGLGACGCSSTPAANAPETTPQAAQRAEIDPVIDAPLPDLPLPPALKREGEILRAELNAFLGQGPAFLLQQVPVKPILDGGDFVGFQVQSFFEGYSKLAQADIQVGDVIVAINTHRIIFPEDLFAVWEGLQGASHLQIDLIRGQTLHTRTWKIRDTVVASP